MTAPTTAPRTIPVRRISFHHPDAAAWRNRHFVGGDFAMSHIVAVLSSLFPEGEEFFVRSVRRYRDRITEPELKRQVSAFIGQEAIHGREHRELNRRLSELGYPTMGVDRFTKRLLALLNRVLPGTHQLAITAALEHYTATLAETLLGDDQARGLFSDDEVRELLLWHAIEESEHKSVAFDVYQQVSGSTLWRRVLMAEVTVGFLVVAGIGAAFSMLRDPWARHHPLRALRSVAALRRNPWVSTSVRRMLRDYYRADFHPDDHDSTALLERWRTELFGDDGRLNDRLATSAWSGQARRGRSPGGCATGR